MTVNTSPIFPKVPHLGMATISTANANRDGTGTIGDVATGVTDGTRITRITIQATGTTTAGMVRLYLYDGSATKLWKEIAVTAITPSASVAAFIYVLTLLGEEAVMLKSTHKLRASTHNAESFNVIAEGGDFTA